MPVSESGPGTAYSETSESRVAVVTPSNRHSASSESAHTGSSGHHGPDAARFATEVSGAGTGTASTESRVKANAWDPPKKKKLATTT